MWHSSLYLHVRLTRLIVWIALMSDLLVEEERVQLGLVEAGLELVDDDHQPVLGALEVLYDLRLAVAAVHRRAGLVLLVVAVDDADGRVRIPRVERLRAPLGHHLADAVAVVDGEGNGRDGQHGLARAVDLAVDEADEPVHDEVRSVPCGRRCRRSCSCRW